MQVSVTFRHLDPDEGARRYVKEKVDKLRKYVENPEEVHVVLAAEKFRQIAELTITVNGVTFNSRGSDSDMYAAIDQMVERMERQIRERKDKGRRKRGGIASSGSRPAEEEFGMEEDMNLKVERRQTFAKPMSPEEAVAQLNLTKGNLLFFINTNSGQMNAICRTGDGSYEWIEPLPE